MQSFQLTGNPITEDVETTSAVTRSVVRDGSTIATLTAEPFNGSATLRYDPIIRTLFRDKRTLLANSLKCYRDDAITAHAYINGTNYAFIRGVAREQIENPTTLKFLATLPMLRWFDGFPLAVAFAVIDGEAENTKMLIDSKEIESGYTHADWNADEVALFDLSCNPIKKCGNVSDFMVYHAGHYIFDSDCDETHGGEKVVARWKCDDESVAEVYAYSTARNPEDGARVFAIDEITGSWAWLEITTINYERVETKSYNGTLTLNSDGADSDSIDIKSTDVPAHPFYVRWINDRGGYDYFMMECRQKDTFALGDNDYFEKDGANGEYETFNKSGSETIEASTGRVDLATYKALARMMYSPDIRWYDKDNESWVRVQIASASPEFMTDQPNGELVVSFLMPNVPINK